MGTSYKTLDSERSIEEVFSIETPEEERRYKHKFTRCEVNEAFIPVKVVYFLYIGALSAIRPFIPVYMYELGLSTFQLGAIRSLGPVVIFLTSPFWGSFADKFSKHRTLLLVGLLGTGLVYPLALLVPPVGVMCQNETSSTLENTKNVEGYQKILIRNNRDLRNFGMENNQNLHRLSYIFSQITGKLNPFKREDSTSGTNRNESSLKSSLYKPSSNSIYYISNKLNATKRTNNLENTSTSLGNLSDDIFVKKEPTITDCSGYTFGSMFCILMAAYTFVAATLVLLDSNTAEMCNYYPGASFGQQRCFGAVASIVFSLVSGLSMDFYALNVQSDPRLNMIDRPYHGEEFVPVFLLFFVLVLSSIYPAMKMAFPSHTPTTSISVSVFWLLKDFRIVCFFAITFVTGACKGITAAYLFVFLEELGASKTLMGLCLAITCATQVPLMFHSSDFVDWLGYDTVFCITLFCNGARFTLYSVMRNPLVVLPIGAIHGIFNGMYTPCCTVYANYIAPPGTSATLQAVLSATKGGLGEAAGILIGGTIYNQFGPVALFQGTAIMSFITLIWYTLMMYLCEKNRLYPGRGSERFLES